MSNWDDGEADMATMPNNNEATSSLMQAIERISISGGATSEPATNLQSAEETTAYAPEQPEQDGAIKLADDGTNPDYASRQRKRTAETKLPTVPLPQRKNKRERKAAATPTKPSTNTEPPLKPTNEGTSSDPPIIQSDIEMDTEASSDPPNKVTTEEASIIEMNDAAMASSSRPFSDCALSDVPQSVQPNVEASTQSMSIDDDKEATESLNQQVSTGARRRDPNYRNNSASTSAQDRGNRHSAVRHNQQLQTPNRKIILIPTSQIGRIIGKRGNKVRELEYAAEVKIKITGSNEHQSEVNIYGTDEAIATAERMIANLIGIRHYSIVRVNPQQTDNLLYISQEYVQVNNEGSRAIDWYKVNSLYEKLQHDRLTKLQKVKKDFYRESPSIAKLRSRDVELWRDGNDMDVRRSFAERPGLKPIPNPVITIEQSFEPYPDILRALLKQGFSAPTAMQGQAWPIILRGEDTMIISQVATGVLQAFLLPAFIHIDGQPIPRAERDGPSLLIVVPHRAVATEIERVIIRLQYRGMKPICFNEGDAHEHIEQLLTDIDIVIAVPERLDELIPEKIIVRFTFVVLVELDIMLDMGAEAQIKKFLIESRPDKQTVLTCATRTLGVRNIALTYMNDPIQITEGADIVGTFNPVVPPVTQRVIVVDEDEKIKTVIGYLRHVGPKDKVIVYCAKKAVALQIGSELTALGIRCQALHGDSNQSDRLAAIVELFHGDENILVTTDAACRGIDIPNVDHVVNFDFPQHIDEYVQRVGMTGREGGPGTALTFVTRDDWAHASDLVLILEEALQVIPIELQQMARAFEPMRYVRRESLRNRGGARGRHHDRRDRDWFD